MNLSVLPSVPLLLLKTGFLSLSLAILYEIQSGSRGLWWWHFILEINLYAFSSGHRWLLLLERKEFFQEERQFCLAICTMSVFLILAWRQSGIKNDQKSLGYNSRSADWFVVWLVNAWVLTICFFPYVVLRQGRTSMLPLFVPLLALLATYVDTRWKTMQWKARSCK